MRTEILSILSAIALIFSFPLPALAGDSGTITITMTGANEISITLDKSNWNLGNIALGAARETTPPVEWCTLNVTGNCNVKTFIQGEDARWGSTDYKWTLSSDGSNGKDKYGLWFRISGDTTRGPNADGYVPIMKTQSEFWPYPGEGSSLAPGDKKQFGLRLVAPSYFYGGRQMQTEITISAVAA